jgi:16S rRNA processing protein RimM
MPQNFSNSAGSTPTSEPAFLVLGKLRRAHGVSGEIPLEVYTHLLELLVPERVVFIGDNHQPFTIENTRWKQDLLLIKFHNISDRTTVSELTNQLVYIKTDQLPPLNEGEFYYHQLIGIHVYEEDGAYLGVLTEILETGANDVYLVKNESGEEILIPATEEMILEIRPDQEKMIVGRMEWYGEGD